MYKVASQAGLTHSHNQSFNPRTRPAGDAQQLSSPFSLLLDDAGGAAPLPPKDPYERSEGAQTSRPADAQQQTPQTSADSKPAQHTAVAGSAEPADETGKTDKTAAEDTAAASLDDHQTDTAPAPDNSGATTAIALANAAQSTPEQSLSAIVIAPVTPFETQATPEQTATSPVIAPAAAPETQPAPQQPAAEAASATSSDTPSAPQQPASTEQTSGGAIPAQAQLTPADSAEPVPAGSDASTAGVPSPKPVSPAKVSADKNGKTAPANPNGSQTADAAQPSNADETANGAHTTNAGPAANEEHRGSRAESTPEDKKQHVPATSAASRVGMQNPEPSAPHAEAHAGDVAQAGKTPDGVQLLTMPQPADPFATVAAQVARSASSQDAAAAAVPLAGLAVEIAARALAGRNRFEIRLDPPELGRIDVRLDVDRNGQVTSRLTVERVETLDALRRDAGDLERALQQAGLKTADNGLQFTLRDQSFAGRDQSFPTTAAARVVVPAPELAAIDAMPAGYGRTPRPGGGIDIRV